MKFGRDFQKPEERFIFSGTREVAHPDPRLLYGNQEQLPETGKTVLIFFLIRFVYPDLL